MEIREKRIKDKRSTFVTGNERFWQGHRARPPWRAYPPAVTRPCSFR
jgi:hypothetical protein